jgi:hypothetical protein
VSAPTTDRLLVRRSLGIRLGSDAADWATEQLVRGVDTPHLRQLAGETGNEDRSEMEELFDHTARELGITPPPRDEAIHLHARFLMQDYLAGRIDREALLVPLSDLCIDTDYRRDLYPFYLLRFALWDLQVDGYTFHREGVTRENFDEKLREEIDTFLANSPQTARRSS